MAVQYINERIGKVISLSAFYVTAPWGFDSDNSFLNAALGVETDLAPLEILDETQEIEKQLGRRLKSQNGVYQDRLIDVDMLLYGDLVFENERLTLPHPLMTQRRFVMEPLTQIAPNLIHPILEKTMHQLLSNMEE